ncbi:MAG: radical SAM protein [Candidatus Acidiferrales bacterium]
MKIKPKRQMSVQFSGGEPTMSPYFLDAVRYARKIGYNSVQAATNGIEFAKSKEFARQAFEAGLRYAYLQFDGIGNEANSHRKVGNLFDVKLKAIENMHEAGIEIILVTTLVNTLNNDQVGPIIRFARDNPRKIAFIAFQPVSFTGRDEDITPERRLKQRYTLSHLARDVKDQVGITEPTRDWFPISLMGAFADFADLVHGPGADWGQVSCGCHPNCGVGTALMINKNTGEWGAVPEFLNIPGLVRDTQKITDAGRGRYFSAALMGLAVLKNYKPFRAPKSLTLLDLLKKFDKSFGVTKETEKKYGSVSPKRTYQDAIRRRRDPWNFLFIAGMWFQDLFNYDFRRTEMCIIPYATQQGEISFCAYNTGIGWRKIIENMYKNATVAEWYKTHGKHEIYARGRSVEMPEATQYLQLNQDDVNRKRERLDASPQTAAEEERLRRKAAWEAAQARALYEEMVLKKPKPTLVQLGAANGGNGNGKPVTIQPATPAPEPVGAHGDD